MQRFVNKTFDSKIFLKKTKYYSAKLTVKNSLYYAIHQLRTVIRSGFVKHFFFIFNILRDFLEPLYGQSPFHVETGQLIC